jgi:hypothetical protein
MQNDNVNMQFLVPSKYLTPETTFEAEKWLIAVEYSTYAQNWQEIIKDKHITLQ